VQFQLDELLYERMLSEIAIYTYRNRERFANWQAVVIYPTRNTEQSRLDIELVSTIIVYKFSNLTREEVAAMLGIEIQQTRVYQDAKADGEKIVVIKQLTRKLGNINITPEIRSRVNNLSIEQLESLSESLLDFGQMSDLIGWLDADQGDRIS
jgi:predicted transposase YdaD